MSAKRRSATRVSANRLAPSARNRPPPATAQNLLLAALPPDDYNRLVPSLDIVSLPLKDILHKPGEPLEYVYFPGGGGFCSILTVMKDGSMVEVATVGREGMVGMSAVFDGEQPVPSAAMVQAETEVCYRMAVRAFREEMDRRGPFYDLLTHYVQALVGFVMVSTACNARHTVEQRLARWLLMAHDRVGKNEFLLTQEFVAMMLGASRPTVTAVAGILQRAGLITYHRGHVTIVDREALEHASCECYGTATDLLAAVTERSRASLSR